MSSERTEFMRAQRRMLDRYGVEASSRFIPIPCVGGEAHVLAAGSGPPVVLINGIGTPGAMWAPLMRQLDAARLFALDLPGFGLTDAPPGFARDLRRNAVRFLNEALDALELERAVLLGNSLGSLVACWMALDRPRRVSCLVHAGCPALLLDTSAPLPMRLLSVPPLGRLLTRLRPPSPRQVEGLSKMVRQYPLVPELVDLLVATERLPDFRRTFLSTLHALLRLRGSRPETRLDADQLARIGHPTLLVWGRDDPFGSVSVGERAAAIIPRAELRIVDGGHTPWLSRPDRLKPILQGFFNRYAGRAIPETRDPNPGSPHGH